MHALLPGFAIDARAMLASPSTFRQKMNGKGFPSETSNSFIDEDTDVIYSSDDYLVSDDSEVYSSDEENVKPQGRFECRSERKTTRKRKEGALQEKETNLQNIIDIPKECCSRRCLETISVNTIQSFREEFYNLRQTEQAEFIKDSLIHRDAYKETKQKPTFLILGKEVCDIAWRIAHGVKYRRYQYIRRKLQVSKGKLNVKDAREGMTYQSEAYLNTKEFLLKYARLFGDDQPDASEVHLPSCVTKKVVFSDYTLHCIANQMKHVKLTWFLKIWKKELPNVKVRKHQKMTQCGECAVFKEAFLKKLTPEEAKTLELKRKAHLTLQRICREKYYKHRNKSAANPETYASVIIDNMDQSKTSIPRFPFASKNDNKLTTLHHHVTGVLSHNLKKTYAFTWTDQFPSNCNITLNCLISCLHDIANANGGGLPPTLYIQADNAGKDNKNNFVLMFLAMLVKAEIVQKIKFSFLMVGHTHEDVDQFFSRVSVKCNQQPAVTLPELHNIIRTSIEPSPVTTHLESLYDFRALADQTDFIFKDIMDKHVFVFKKRDEQIILKYKNWPLASEVAREEDITSLVPNISQPAVWSEGREEFKATLKKMSDDLTKWKSSGRVTADNHAWWIRYLRSFEGGATIPQIPRVDLFQKYKIPRKRGSTIDQDALEVINRHLKKCRKVTVIKISKKRGR